MKTNQTMVKHINQNVSECYEHCSIQGWIPVDYDYACDNWSGGSFEYHELRHNQDKITKGILKGLYGRFIIG